LKKKKNQKNPLNQSITQSITTTFFFCKTTPTNKEEEEVSRRQY